MICEYCRNQHDGTFASGRFCNMQCSRGFSSKAARKQLNERMMKDHPCKKCGEIFHGHMSLMAHMRLHTRKFEDLTTDRSRKRWIEEETGHICSTCKLSDWLSRPIPLEIDHIDGNPENNTRSNLRLICPNCHCFTDTYKGRNMGKVVNSKRQQTMLKYRSKYR